jgi:hypothetical protein
MACGAEILVRLIAGESATTIPSRTKIKMVKTVKYKDAGTKKNSIPLGLEARHFGAGATSLVVNDSLNVHWNNDGKALGHRANLHAQKSFGQHLPKGVGFMET